MAGFLPSNRKAIVIEALASVADRYNEVFSQAAPVLVIILWHDG